MRLDRLTLLRYGCFEAVDLALDPVRLNLVLAPNGAGKSVLRQAFADLLCGIPVRSPMDFRFGVAGMRLLAEAVLPDGRRLAFGRRKGQGNTLIDAAGAPLDRAVLEAATGAVDRALLERLFAIDTTLLRRGGEGLLASGGALADALVSAAGGLRQARGLLGTLREDRDALAPERRMAARPFHQALDQLAAARKALDEAVFTPQAWAGEQAALEQAQARRATANAAAQGAALRIAQLERLRRVRPLLVAHDVAADWLAAHPDAPLLPADLGPHLAAARTTLATAAEGARIAQARHARVAEDIAALAPDPKALVEADAISALVDHAGAVRKAMLDLPGVAAEHRLAEAEAARLRHELGNPATLPPPMALREARRLIGEHERLASELRRLPAQRAARGQDAQDARAALAALPPQNETAGLAALVREIRAAGDPAARAEAAADTLRRRRAEAATALSVLPGWRGAADALAALVVPAPAAFEVLDAAQAAARQRTALARDAEARAVTASAASRARLEELGELRDLIDPDAVATARRHRDRGWDLVFRQGFTAAPPTPEDIAAWSGGATLPLAYGTAVAAADTLADRRAAMAGRVGEAAASDRAAGLAAEALAVATADREAADAAQAEAQARWYSACIALGLPPDTGAAALRAFVQGRDVALAAEREGGLAAQAAAALGASHAVWRDRLAAALGGGEGGLPARLAEAELRLQQREAQMAARAEAAAGLRAAEAQLAQLAQAEAVLGASRAAWQPLWVASQGALGRPPGEAPELVGEVLGLYADLAAATAQDGALRTRVDGMRADSARFAAEIAALAARLSPEADASDPFTLLRDLRARHEAARATADRHALLTRAGHAAAAELDQASEALVAGEARLGEVIAAAGAEDVGGAEAAIVLAVVRAGHAARRDEAAAALREAGDGREMPHLRAEAGALPADQLMVEMALARDHAAEANLAAQQAASEAARIEAGWERLTTDLRAVTARAEEEASLATLGRVLDEALVLHAAGLLLEQGLARVEAAGTGTLLARIAAHVAQLTDGAYDQVTTEEAADGTAVLRVRQPGVPDEPKKMDQLSEGTRDQLFLALRLVAIEDYVRTSPPLPFIADDILQTFDDRRASLALTALAELNRRAQVVVLTHHPHVADLAAASGLDIRVHRLAAA